MSHRRNPNRTHDVTLDEALEAFGDCVADGDGIPLSARVFIARLGALSTSVGSYWFGMLREADLIYRPDAIAVHGNRNWTLTKHGWERYDALIGEGASLSRR